MVKDNSDSEKGNVMVPLHEQQVFFYMHYATDRIAHTMASYTSHAAESNNLCGKHIVISILRNTITELILLNYLKRYTLA